MGRSATDVGWKTPEFAVGDPVWLHPDKDSTERHLGKITKVKCYGAHPTRIHTILYDTDIVLGKNNPVRGISVHWFRPVSAIDRLGDLLGRTGT